MNLEAALAEALTWGDALFDSQPGNRLSWLRYFVTTQFHQVNAGVIT